MIVRTNSPFSMVLNKNFRRYTERLRPGYVPPDRHEVGGPLLDTVYEQENAKIAVLLHGKLATLAFDGWSDPKSNPVIGVSTTVSGETYLCKTIYTHTAKRTQCR